MMIVVYVLLVKCHMTHVTTSILNMFEQPSGNFPQIQSSLKSSFLVFTEDWRNFHFKDNVFGILSEQGGGYGSK